MRKVYGLLSVQLTMTTLIGGVFLFTPGVKEFVQARPAFLVPAFFLSIGLLIALHIKRKETPINLVLLACFTVVEAYTVGTRLQKKYVHHIMSLIQESWSHSSTKVLSSKPSS